ncbi:hypothetical protein DEDE109153_10700 [Deinococcus deserti]
MGVKLLLVIAALMLFSSCQRDLTMEQKYERYYSECIDFEVAATKRARDADTLDTETMDTISTNCNIRAKDMIYTEVGIK